MSSIYDIMDFPCSIADMSSFDFTSIGQAIKKAREARGMTREQLSGIIGYAPRHIQSIENEGQYPSIELFIQLITDFIIFSRKKSRCAVLRNLISDIKSSFRFLAKE